MLRFIKNAKEGAPVTVSSAVRAKGFACQFRFKALGQTISVLSPFGISVGLDILRTFNVKYEVAPDRPHHTPFASKAKASNIARRLGNKLKGRYARGPCKGEIFQKWIQCHCEGAITKACKIIDFISPGQSCKDELSQR